MLLPGATVSSTMMKLENPKQVQAMTKGQGDSRKRPKYVPSVPSHHFLKTAFGVSPFWVGYSKS